jgi:microcystin-dependent protein
VSDPFIGEMRAFGFNFAPRGWALCAGQLLQISQNSALFALLGTTYGGNGTTNFALPDLRGRTMVNQGQGPGLSNMTLGQQGGTETVTLLVANLPAHNHTATLFGENAFADSASPTGKLLATPDPTKIYAPSSPQPNVAMSSESIVVNNTGSNTPIQIRSPFLVVNVCIALQGIFPSRN